MCSFTGSETQSGTNTFLYFTQRATDLHEHGEDLLIGEVEKMFPLRVSSEGIVRAGFYGSAVASLLYDANVFHIQLQHLQRQTDVCIPWKNT